MELDIEPSIHSGRFSYADYEKAIRQPYYENLRYVSSLNAAYFKKCQRVLDLASGQGFLLDVLREMEIPALGVDNEKNLVEVCRSRGLNIVEDDLFHFLATTEEVFDGLSCNHIIEHLPYQSFVDLVEGVRRVLKPGGIFLLNWPNPRCAVTQFQNFWKDPTHSRFYDGDFVKAVLTFYDFEISETFYDTVVPRIFSTSDGVTSTDDVTKTEHPRDGGLRKSLISKARQRLIRILGLDDVLTEHRVHSQRLEIFDFPGDARIVALRK